MAHYSNKALIPEIQNGNEDVLVYLSGKYFAQSRHLVRLKGLSEDRAPGIFSTVLVRVWMNVLQHRLPASVEFETFFFNSLKEEIEAEKRKKKEHHSSSDIAFAGDQKEIVAQCVSILDESSRQLIYARYAEFMSFESIAARFTYSNAVIAQYEVNKAIQQLQGIVKVRLSIPLN